MLLRLFIATLERADLMALVCDVYCNLVTFPFGIFGCFIYSLKMYLFIVDQFQYLRSKY